MLDEPAAPVTTRSNVIAKFRLLAQEPRKSGEEVTLLRMHIKPYVGSTKDEGIEERDLDAMRARHVTEWAIGFGDFRWWVLTFTTPYVLSTWKNAVGGIGMPRSSKGARQNLSHSSLI